MLCCMAIGGIDPVFGGQSADHHQHRRSGHMEVGEQAIYYLEFKSRADEDAGRHLS